MLLAEQEHASYCKLASFPGSSPENWGGAWERGYCKQEELEQGCSMKSWNICMWNVLLIGRLTKEGTIPVVLSSLSSVARFSWCSDSLLLLYHSLISRLAHKGTD